MRKKIVIATSPITNTIYAGHALKDGRTFAANKQDVTAAALTAVVEYLQNLEQPVVLSVMGVPTLEITLRDLTET